MVSYFQNISNSSILQVFSIRSTFSVLLLQSESGIIPLELLYISTGVPEYNLALCYISSKKMAAIFPHKLGNIYLYITYKDLSRSIYYNLKRLSQLQKDKESSCLKSFHPY